MEAVADQLVPSLVENGVFGEFKLVRLESNEQTEIGAQFASSLAFFNLVVEGSSGEKVFSLVVKVPTADPEERELRNTDAMFYNEVTMYKEILPALGYDERCLPKMYHGIATAGVNSDDDIVILENLKYKGFVPSKPRIFLDFDHISLAIKRIAEFHSLSYKLKNDNREKFEQLLKKLKKVTYNEVVEKEFDIMKGGGLKRGVEAALKKKKSPDQLKKCIPLLDSSSELIKLINHPEEPFSIICHGDFCNNNILFRYSDTDEPVECIFFDFQLSLYSSPAVDLMFLLYMNTTSDFREKYWDEILKLYWDTVRKNVTAKLPSFEEFAEHIAKRAMYGYLISGWFLPLLLDEGESGYDQGLSLEEKTELFRKMGGEKAEKIICDILLHLSEMNYLHKFLDFYDEKKIQH